MADHPPVIAGPRPRSFNWAWPASFGVVALATIAALVFLLDRGCRRATESVQSITSAFKPNVNVTTVFASTAERVRKQAKLVVMSADVTVEIRKNSDKVQEILGMSFDFGTTMVRVRATGNKIQFVVPLDKIDPKDFDYDPVHRRINVHVPAPVADAALVEVQTDPAKIECETKVGWARLDNRSGKILRDEALRELRDAVLREGRSDLYTEKAKASAREAVLKLLAPFAAELQDNVEVQVDFR